MKLFVSRLLLNSGRLPDSIIQYILFLGKSAHLHTVHNLFCLSEFSAVQMLCSCSADNV